jgi:hypothetical protein
MGCWNDTERKFMVAVFITIKKSVLCGLENRQFKPDFSRDASLHIPFYLAVTSLLSLKIFILACISLVYLLFNE